MASKGQSSSAQQPKPLVKRPPGAKYHTLLSIDGGGIRGIIPTVVLMRLEVFIKEHLFENRATLLPESVRSSITSVDDFDIDLTDYFDLVAGTSIGSILATYIAARGKGAEKLMNNSKWRKKYERLRVGSMEVVLAVFKEYSCEVFPVCCRNLRIALSFCCRSRYSNSGLKKLLDRVFSEKTMDDLDTGLLVTSYDLKHRAACSFLRGTGTDKSIHTVHTATRSSSKSTAEGGVADPKVFRTLTPQETPGWAEDIVHRSDLNYRLKDITLASASAPTYLPPAKISPVGHQRKMILVDGGIVANNPSLQALTYAPTAFLTNDIKEKIAILSVGCGTPQPEQDTDDDPGILWWLMCGNLTSHMMEGSSEYVQAVMEYWLYQTVGVKPGQYTRIQKTPEDKDMEAILADMDNARKVYDLEGIGETVANENAESLRRFVREFLFAV